MLERGLMIERGATLERGVLIELGMKQSLNVVKETDFGVYLGTETEKVLLPKKQVPEGTQIGDPIDVFIYRDSSDRLIATTNEPLIELNQIAALKVVEVGAIGAFLNWGLEKDLLLPFKEQTFKVKEDDECLVALYIDKSSRLCATMKVYDYLENGSVYIKDSHVSGTIIEINPEFGVFVAIDNQYYGMIPKAEMFNDMKVGDHIDARVTKVREDGKLLLSVKQKAYIQMDEDSKLILDELEKNGGSLPFTDKADPEFLKSKFHMSKNAFKRAIGRLLKEGKINLKSDSIEEIK